MSASKKQSHRREFLATSAATIAGVTMLGTPAVHAGGSDVIKVGIIGCGGRGRGAGEDVLSAAPGVEIVALGDYFESNANAAKSSLSEYPKAADTKAKPGNKCENPAIFSGIDAYRKVVDHPGVNYVILATPPGFRPPHLQYAINAGKNVFTEKPVAVDGPGIRTCFALYEATKDKPIGIAAGTQRRHQAPYIETIKQIHDKAIGDVVAARCYWNQGPIWFRKRSNGMSNLDYQIHNWYHFVWLCGDHICEQHVHNLDVVNWAVQSHPIRALGMGGRTMPCSDPNVDGHIYNYFAVQYEYPNGMHLLSMCRQVANSDGNMPGTNGVSEALVGTKGTCQVNEYKINGKPVVERQRGQSNPNPYVQEHTDLIASIRSGKPINELKSVTESTLAAIMGRMSAYTGKVVTWEQAMNSKLDTMPKQLDASASLPVPPVAVAGKTELI